MRPRLRIAAILAAAALAFGAAWAVAIGRGIAEVQARWRRDPPPADPAVVREVPLPHHVPEYPGGLTLRFAMVHDVIHERFANHGPAYYEARNRQAREFREVAPVGNSRWEELTDDLATGLERLGRSGEAETLMREKLAQQEARRAKGIELYTSYANLGTYIIHDNFLKATQGDLDARRKFREGVEFIRKSVEVNPQAHFGRERWQASIAGFLLAAMERPELLGRFDCLGNRLDRSTAAILKPEDHLVDGDWHARPATLAFRTGHARGEVPAYFQPGARIDDLSNRDWPEFAPIRQFITRVGAEEGWEAVEGPTVAEPAPFDEPTLGIIGMWRQGGGANPHFALALGETMLRVGQRYIAWDAYERAARLADRFGPDPAAHQKLIDHCRKRQAEIEATVQGEPLKPRGRAAVANLRAEFDAELARGQEYRALYHRYEADRIAAGASFAARHFDDPFRAAHPPIASVPGPEEMFRFVDPEAIRSRAVADGWAWGTFAAGLAALVVAVLTRPRRANRIETA